jgi:CopG-like RHH_1 or ribbon-helix-helix domain, RHH_5
MPAGRRPRVMFVTDDRTKEALEKWADVEGRTVSNLLDELVKEVLVQKGFIEPPKKLLSQLGTSHKT